MFQDVFSSTWWRVVPTWGRCATVSTMAATTPSLMSTLRSYSKKMISVLSLHSSLRSACSPSPPSTSWWTRHPTSSTWDCSRSGKVYQNVVSKTASDTLRGTTSTLTRSPSWTNITCRGRFLSHFIFMTFHKILDSVFFSWSLSLLHQFSNENSCF